MAGTKGEKREQSRLEQVKEGNEGETSREQRCIVKTTTYLLSSLFLPHSITLPLLASVRVLRPGVKEKRGNMVLGWGHSELFFGYQTGEQLIYQRWSICNRYYPL